MKANSILNVIWRRISKYLFNLIMAIIALIVLKTPLQHYVSLGRYQHIGIAIFLFGMGYVMQMIWSWRTWSKWARVSNIATSLFFCSVGIFFYANSWVDNSVADPTTEKMLLRSLFIGIYCFFSFMVAALWLKSMHEDGKLEEQQKLASAGASVQAQEPNNETTNKDEIKK